MKPLSYSLCFAASIFAWPEGYPDPEAISKAFRASDEKANETIKLMPLLVYGDVRVHGANDYVCTLYRQVIQQAVQAFVDFHTNILYNLVGTVQKCKIIRAILPGMLDKNAVM